MQTDNRFFTLPLHFDVAKLIEDLATAEAQQWTSHFNQQDYDGQWTGIALRSATGESANINALTEVKYHHTPLMEHCQYFREIVEMFECEIESVRLLALMPGSEIKTHRDHGLGYQHGCFRLHIPILTDELVDFVVDGEKLDMQPGTLWYANFDLMHSVKHAGTTRRIHLIIDGKRNAWTDELFGKAGYDFSKENLQPVYDAETSAKMIAHLREMGTETALALIEQLQQSVAEKKNVRSFRAPS